MPQGPQGSQGPQRPQRPQGSHRRPEADGWRPDGHPRPPPPAHEALHHQPGYDDIRPAGPLGQSLGQEYPDDPPWRRTQRRPGREEARWQPAQASYDQGDFHPRDQRDPRDQYDERRQYEDQDQYADDADYEDGYTAGGRLLPGFPDEGDAGYDHDHGVRRRRRRARQDSRGGGHGGRRARRPVPSVPRRGPLLC